MSKISCELTKEITKEIISDLEGRIDFKFDSIFSEFMLKNNAGHPNKNLIDVRENEEMINNFLSLDIQDKYNIFYIYQDNEYMKKLGCIPIARDPGGNYFCISKIDRKIYFWDHEVCNDGEEPYYVCEDFQSLLDSLYDED